MYITTELTLEDVDRRWKHRAGWPLLCSLPVSTGQLFSDRPDLVVEANLNQLESRVNDVLARYRIETRAALDRAVRTQARYLGELPSKDLRIIVDCIYNPDREKEDPDSWSLAVIEIREIIRETVHHPRDIGVELCDMEYEKSIQFTDLPHGFTEFHQNWDDGENYEQQILAEFNNRPQLWQVMMPIGLSAKNEYGTHHTCAVWFDAIDADDYLWRDLEKKLAMILPADISVEIWQAAGGFLSDTLPVPGVSKFLNPDDFTWPPLPGASIGVEHERGSGTLGGYVRVQEPTTDETGQSTFHDRTYGITNAHVALGDQLPKVFREIRWDRNSFQQGRQIRSPSLEDCENFVENLQRVITLYEDPLNELQNELALFQESNDVPYIEHVKFQLNGMKAIVDPLREQVTVAQKDFTMGPVTFLAFGNRNPSDKPEFKRRLIMDIALIDASRLIPSPEYVSFPVKTNDEWSSFYSNKICKSWYADGLASKSNRSPDIEVVAIYGRTSGFSMGIVHGIKVNVDVKLKNLDGTKRYLSAYAVRSASSQSAFSLKGDSGSLVFAASIFKDGNHRNRLTTDANELVIVGVLFASSPHGRIGYFIPFDEVVKEIEDLTGGRVIWPIKRA
jgi:hypothetical protein